MRSNSLVTLIVLVFAVGVLQTTGALPGKVVEDDTDLRAHDVAPLGVGFNDGVLVDARIDGANVTIQACPNPKYPYVCGTEWCCSVSPNILFNGVAMLSIPLHSY
jgi:hypothetical protein